MSEGQRRGIPFVVAAPSGTGKTTVCKALIERDPELRLSISHTTRAERVGETDGVEYHFVDEKVFRKMVAEGAFLEHAEYNGRHYGTSWAAIDAPLAAGHDVLLEIEVQGARQVHEKRDDACLIFLLPPDLQVLEARLRGRGTDDDATIDRRMALVDREIAAAELFDYAVVNDELEACIQAVRGIISAIREGEPERVASQLRKRVLPAWKAAQG